MMPIDIMVNDLTKTEINGAKLKAAREAVGLTQRQAAVKVGVTKQTLSNYECGHGYPSANIFVRLCMLYGIQGPSVTQNN